jgi:Beta-xylosidase
MGMKRINFLADTTVLAHTWSCCVGAGRANEGLRADWQAQLRDVVQNCGFQYLRFHGLFHDDMHVYRVEDGAETYNFQYIDALFDALLDIGIRPFVELGFLPKDMASNDAVQFWWKGNVAPPKDLEKWGGLIRRFLRHLLDRYGRGEVEHWRFEVWNEPNLNCFWNGTRSQYFELYKTTVLAAKSIGPYLKVGGPATSNFVPDERFGGETEDLSAHATFRTDDIDRLPWRGVWINEFLDYCAKEDLPVDFISCHPYPTDFALDGQGRSRGRSRRAGSTREDVEWLRRARACTRYGDAELHLTEWNSSPSPRDYGHDYLPTAAYVMKTNLDVGAMADSLSYWTFTDIFEENGAGPKAFHGGFGLITMQGVKKPTYYAYRFLNELGTKELDRGDGYILTKDENGRLYGAFYNYPAEFSGTVPMSMYPDQSVAKKTQDVESDRDFYLAIDHVTPDTCFQMEIVDREHGVAVGLWNSMGAPGSPDREQTGELIRCAQSHRFLTFQSDENGTLGLRFTLPAWAIAGFKEL